MRINIGCYYERSMEILENFVLQENSQLIGRGYKVKAWDEQ